VLGQLTGGGALVRAVGGIEAHSPGDLSKWRVGAYNSASDQREFIFQDLLAGNVPYAFGFKWDGTAYVLRSESGSLLQLGESAKRIYDIHADDGHFFSGVHERSRTVAMGAWTAVSFSAGDYAGTGAMTLTVAAGDVVTSKYTLLGTTLVWTFDVVTATVGGTVNTDLKITIPDGFTAAAQTNHAMICRDNGVAVGGWAVTQVGVGYVLIRKVDFTNWTLAADTTYLSGTLSFEVQ
jgi:hypothetical protein